MLSHASREHTEYGTSNCSTTPSRSTARQAHEFVDTYQPGELIIIAGRLDSQEHMLPVWLWKRLGGARKMRPHDYARGRYRTWIIEPLASIIAHTITTSSSHVDHNQAQLPV